MLRWKNEYTRKNVFYAREPNKTNRLLFNWGAKMKTKYIFNLSEEIEVEAETLEDAYALIESGEYERLEVFSESFLRIEKENKLIYDNTEKSKYPKDLNNCNEEQLQHFMDYVNDTYIVEEDTAKTLYHSFIKQIKEEGFEVE